MTYTLVDIRNRQTFWIGGQQHSVIVGGEQTAGRYSIAHSRMAVGIGASEHIHGREAEAFYILKGKFRFLIGGEERLLEPGAFLHIEPGLAYSFVVLPPEAGELLVLYAPAGLESFIGEVGVADSTNTAASERAAAQSLSDIARMKSRATAYGLTYVERT